MAQPYKSIERIKRVLVETLDATEKSRLILYHLNIATRKSSIWSEKNWSDPDEVSKQVWEAAQAHAESLGGPQRFQLCSYDIDDDGDAIRTCSFHVDRGLSSEREPAGSEPPTTEGMTALLMRHNEEMSRQHNAAIGALTHHLARTVEKQADQIDKLMADRMQTITILEELMSKKHERDLATKEAEEGNKRKQEMFDKIMQLAPMALNKLTGTEIVRQKSSALEATVMSFMEAIKPTDLDRIASSGIFNQQQIMLFSTILEQVTKTMISSEEKHKQLEVANKAMNNELDVPR